jgi:hypothetical protein
MPALSSNLDFDGPSAIARQWLYRFAALSLLDPQAGSWEALQALRSDEFVAEAVALIRETPAAVPHQLALGERPLAALDPSSVLAHLPSSREQFNEEYEDTT